MNIRSHPPLHLTYCLNVHPGEAWSDNFAAIRDHALAVKYRAAPDVPFGLGLRLARQAAETLRHPALLAEFRDFMVANDLYAFTINGFPYGNFHSGIVKTAVYRPDWATRERLDYTLLLGELLGKLLPEGVDGSISTVPLGYRTAGTAPLFRDMAVNLAECAAGLHRILTETGREIHVGLEPEPDCLMETTDDVIRFFEGPLSEYAVPHLATRLTCSRREAEAILRRHTGVCVDTCHLAIQFETPADSLTRLARHGIRISKVQLSSALETTAITAARQRLTEFIDPTYLHQVKEMALSPDTGTAAISSYPDLPDALSTSETAADTNKLWRIHFHVPLYFESDGILHSTAKTMDARFWDHLLAHPVTHLEIETYTFPVLPPPLRAEGVDASVVREYEWVLNRTHGQRSKV